MLNLLLEPIFVGFPIAVLTVLSSAALGGYFLGLTGAIVGSGVGLIAWLLCEV